MSGRRRGPGSKNEHRQSGPEEGRQADLDDQSLMGNQALTSRMGADAHAEDPLTLARDAALPMVDRGVLALQIDSVGPARLGRFEEILGRSALDADRRAAILDRLQTDELVAADVASAVRSVFGEDSEAVRDQVGSALDAVVDALSQGRPAEGGWELQDGRTVELRAEGGRANALVESVADAVAQTPGSHSSSGARILAFCQRVQLALLLEDEEEEVGPDYGTEEVEG